MSTAANIATNEAFGSLAVDQFSQSAVFGKVTTELSDAVNILIQSGGNPIKVIPALILKTEDIIADFMTAYNISNIMQRFLEQLL